MSGLVKCGIAVGEVEAKEPVLRLSVTARTWRHEYLNVNLPDSPLRFGIGLVEDWSCY